MVPTDEENPVLRWLARRAEAGVIPTITEIEDAVNFTVRGGRTRALEALRRVAINHAKAVNLGGKRA